MTSTPDGLLGTDPSPSLRRRIAGRVGFLLLSAVTFYLVAPSLVEVLSSWDRVARLEPWWLLLVFGCQVASLACLWGLQRLILRTDAWFPIVTSQLAGNAASRVVPGGAATGTAVQYRLLRSAGIGTTNAASGLAAGGLLQIGIICALPLAAMPAVLLGSPAPRQLRNAALLGAGLFVLVAALVFWVMRDERPLRLLGRLIARLVGRAGEGGDLSDRLLAERELIRTEIGGRWGRVVALAVGRAAMDFLTLLTAMAALGADARPALVLLVYATSALLTMVPLTPGGLGFVEAGLTGTLTVAGVGAAAAVGVALLYRLASFWLPIPAGLIAAGVHRVRYRSRPRSDAAMGG